MEKKKIAIFAENLYGGGVEKILQIICRYFDYTKYDLTLYASRKEKYPEGTYPSNIHHKYIFANYVPSDKLHKRLWVLIKNKLKLYIYYHFSPEFFFKLFVREKYDTGIAFIEGYATRILSGAPEDMRKIAWIHIELGTFHWTKIAFRSTEEEMDCYKKMNKIACVSAIVKKQADNLFNNPSKTTVIHNPIDINRIILQSNEPLNIEIKRHKIRFISLGTLNKRKSYDRLLIAINSLIKEGLRFETLILGEGEERKNLESYIYNNELQNFVKLIGFVDNPYPYIKSADVYICTSTAEGYNTAVSEAIILGKAVISTEVSGIREQLGENSEYGIITENSEVGIYNGIKKMLNDEQIKYYQEKSKERLHLFNIDKQMQEIYNLIDA